jgi:ion channel-forming bestrophin family protein
MLTESNLPYRYLMSSVKSDVMAVVTISLGFQALKFFVVEQLPNTPLQLPTVLGTSIALLLAFNLNQSYDRWWEARKIWGSIVNDSRTLLLQLQAFVDEAGECGEFIERMARRQILWCHSLGQSLRDREPLTPEQRRHLPDADDALLARQVNKPFGLLALHARDLSALVKKGAINAYQQVQLDNTLVRLCDSMGRAERIKSTVFPVTYRLFIHFFIYLFLILLSLSLVETIGLYEIPILTAIASTFFLVEKTARHMQDPFADSPTDTPMTAIATTVELNLKQLLGAADEPAAAKPGPYYLM